MVVLQLGPYPPPHGGVQTNLVAIRDHLRRHSFGAPVVNITRHRRVDHDEVYYPRTAFDVMRLLWQVPADVIHIHIGGQLTRRLLGLCLLATLIPRRRVVLTFHSGGYPSWAGHGASRRSLRGFVLRRLDAIIAVNAEIASLFQRLGVHPSRIRIISPFAPVRVDDSSPYPEPLASFLARHRPVLTTVGLLEPEYDLALQIRTLEEVRRRFPDAGLVIVGAGSLETDLRRIIHESPVADHVLLCGDVPHALTVRLIARSDLFLRTTLYDGDSVSVREALHLGTPVIATDNGMRPSGVHLIQRRDADGLLSAIERHLSAEQCRDRAQDTGTKDQQLDAVLDLYRQVIRGVDTVRGAVRSLSES
jgi:glycogen synthase